MVLKDLPVDQACLVPLEERVHQVPKATRAMRASQDCQGFRDPRVFPGLPGQRESRDPRVSLESRSLELRAWTEVKVSTVSTAKRESLVQRESEGPLAIPSEEFLVCPVPWVPRVTEALTVLLADLEFLELLGLRVSLVAPAYHALLE